jgi:lysozyme
MKEAPMTRAIPQAAFAIVKDKEQLVLFAYDDAHWPPKEAVPGDVINGTLTAGYGHTGPDVSIGMVVTQDIAEEWLIDDFFEAAYALEKKVGAAVIDEMSENQYAASLDFVLNLGTGDPRKPEWTIWKRVRARAWDQIPLEMAKFVNATVKDKDGTKKTVKLNGLVDRRNAEIGLWAVQEPGAKDQNLPSSVTRKIATPPTPSDPVPTRKSKALIVGAAGAVAGAGPMVDQVTRAIQPYASHSHYVQQMLGGLAAVGAACAGLAIFLIWLQKRNANN